MGRVIVGIMGPGEGASDRETRTAYDLGKLVARRGWVLLTGGRAAGVMDAAGRGAKDGGGIVVGILPGADASGMSGSVDIPIITGMLEARNSINVLSSRVLFFVGMSAGTASELALALKYRKHSILIAPEEEVVRAFESASGRKLRIVGTPAEAVETAEKFLDREPEPKSGGPGPSPALRAERPRSVS